VRRFSKIIAENIPGAEYREVKNGGHIPFVEKPRETSALVIEFLGEQAGSRSAA
jgi:pimeloyl-ACP methyl ester carboxylesterase